MSVQSASRGFAILSIAGIIAKFMSLIYIPILTRILGEGMGIYYALYEVFVFIYALTNIGLQSAISKYVAELTTVGNYKDALRVFKLAKAFLIGVGLIIMFIMFFGAEYIASFMNRPELVPGIMFLSPAILTTAILATYKGFFQGKNNMKPLATASVLEQIINVFLSIFLGYLLMFLGIEFASAGATLGTSLGAIVAVIYLIYIYKKLKPGKEALIKQDANLQAISIRILIKVLCAYALPIMLSSGLQNLGGLIDAVNVPSRLYVAGFNESEINVMYSLLGQWKTLTNIPMVLIAALGTVLLPILSSANVIKDKINLVKNINFGFRLTYILTVPAVIGLTILAKEVYLYLFGNIRGYNMLVFGSVIVVLTGLVFVQNIILQSLNKFNFVLYSLAGGLTIKFISNYFLISHKDINIFGAIISFIIYYLFVVIVNNNKIMKVASIKVNHFNLIIRPFIASIYMGGIILMIKMSCSLIFDAFSLSSIVGLFYLIIIVSIGIVFYMHGLLITKAISKEDIMSFSLGLYNRLPIQIKNRLQ